MDEKLKLITQALGKERVKFGEKLKSHTFTKSDGEAEGFYIATNQRELTRILDLTHELNIPHFIIGAGTKVLLSSKVKGMVIKNRTTGVKVAGVKGKVGKEGIGIEEAYVESDSGVSLNKLNDFLKKEKLKQAEGFSSLNATVGGAIFLDPILRGATQSLKVWDDGEVVEIKLEELRREMAVLSVIFKFKSKDF